MLWNSKQFGEHRPHAFQRADKCKVSCAVAHVNNFAGQLKPLNHFVEELDEPLCLKRFVLFNSFN